MNKRYFSMLLSCTLALICIVGFHMPAVSETHKAPDFFARADENTIIQAYVSGLAKGTKVSTFRCSTSPLPKEKEAAIMNLINPYMFKDYAIDDFSLVSERDGTIYEDAGWTIERIYAPESWDANTGIPPYYIFSDGTIIADNEQQPPYSTVTYDSTANIDFDQYLKEYGDLSFASKSDIVGASNELLNAIGISVDATPAIMLSYTDDNALIDEDKAIAYREFWVNGQDLMVPYKELVYEYGSELYQLFFAMSFDGIPVSVFGQYLNSEDVYTIMPDIQLWYNKNGLVHFRATSLYEVTERLPARPIIGVEDAAKTFAEYANDLILSEPMECTRIRLEYFALPYEGYREMQDAELVPMWVFYLKGGDAPIVVNAFTNTVLW